MFYGWTQDRYFVGANDDGNVVIYQGIQQELGPIQLAHEVETTDIAVDDLTRFRQQEIERTISVATLDDARAIVERLEESQ